MRHITLYENFNYKEVFEAAIPVYNELEMTSKPEPEPDFTAKYSELIDVLEDFLEKKKAGEISEVTVIADIPTQGKGAPDYVEDIIRQERERVASRMRSQGYNPEVDDIDLDRFGDKRNIFFDSEFVVDSVQRDEFDRSGGRIVGIPYSFWKKGDMTKKAIIDPLRVDEVFYKPIK
jgi:hypothetical protein